MPEASSNSDDIASVTPDEPQTISSSGRESEDPISSREVLKASLNYSDLRRMIMNSS